MLAVLAGFAAFIFYKNGKLKLSDCFVISVLAFFISFVLAITIIERTPSPSAQYELIPFWSYRAIANGRTDLRSEVFWNIVLFIPIGTLLSVLLNKARRFIPVIPCFLFSAAIELTQLFTHRGLFEFDDIIHNTLGAVIGILLYMIAERLIKASLRKNKLS